MRQAITETPTALTGLTVGTRYACKNRSHNVVFVQTAADVPADTGAAFDFKAGEWFTVRVTSEAPNAYIWSPDASSEPGAVVYDEVA